MVFIASAQGEHLVLMKTLNWEHPMLLLDLAHPLMVSELGQAVKPQFPLLRDYFRSGRLWTVCSNFTQAAVCVSKSIFSSSDFPGLAWILKFP